MPRAQKLQNHKLRESYGEKLARFRQDAPEDLERRQELNHLDTLQAFQCSWILQLSLCSLREDMGKKSHFFPGLKEDCYLSCRRLLQEMLNLQHSHALGSVAEHEFYEAVALYWLTLRVV